MPLRSWAVISFDGYMQSGGIQAFIGTFVRTLKEYGASLLDLSAVVPSSI